MTVAFRASGLERLERSLADAAELLRALCDKVRRTRVACAVQMLEAGWTVHYLPNQTIDWRKPDDIGSVEWQSMSLDNPPPDAVNEAIRLGHIKFLPEGAK